MEKEAKSAEPDMGAGLGRQVGRGRRAESGRQRAWRPKWTAGAGSANGRRIGSRRRSALSATATRHRAANVAPDPMPDEEMLYDLADLFKVFGDTTRIKILYALMGTELCVADIADLIGATQSAVSHQLRTLKQARLVKFQRDGKNVIYALSDDHVYTMLAQGMTHICE